MVLVCIPQHQTPEHQHAVVDAQHGEVSRKLRAENRFSVFRVSECLSDELEVVSVLNIDHFSA